VIKCFVKGDASEATVSLFFPLILSLCHKVTKPPVDIRLCIMSLSDKIVSHGQDETYQKRRGQVQELGSRPNQNNMYLLTMRRGYNTYN